MPENYPLRDTILTTLHAQEPWPDNVKLYQPYEVEQILLPDNASCLSVQAFLKMCKLPFEVEMRWNAEFMSPSGRVPFIKCGAFVISELEPIVHFVANKGMSLCTKLSSEEKAEMRAYMSLINNVLVNAELFVSWVDEETFNTVTKVRNSSVYPWPLGWIQTKSKRAMVLKRLKALQWQDKTMEQVLYDVEQCCNSLSRCLGEKDFFFKTPTPLDCLIYGHMRALLNSQGPKSPNMIKHITGVLLKHTLRVANLTQMALTGQEEYLLTQAFTVAQQRRLSPDRIMVERKASERNARKKSRLIYSNVVVDKNKDANVLSNAPGVTNVQHAFQGGETLPPDEPIVTKSPSVEAEPERAMESIENSKAPSEQGIEDYVKFDDMTTVLSSADDFRCDDSYDEIGGNESPFSDDVSLNDTVVIEPEMLHEKQKSLDTIMEQEQTEASISDYQDIVTSPFIGNEDTEIDDAKESPSKHAPAFISNEDYETDDAKECSSKNDNFEQPSDTEPNIDSVISRPTELDALVFGHVFTIITTRLPCKKLAEIVMKHDKLVALAKRVDEYYFRRPSRQVFKDISTEFSS